MGTGASIQSNQTVDSTEICTSCEAEVSSIFHCDKCGRHVCVNCCSHCPRKRNPLYQKRLYTISVEEIANEPNQVSKEVRGGCLTYKGKVAMLCCYNLPDSQSYWKLCFIGEKGKVISDRLSTTEVRQRLPGQLTFSKAEIYMTAPAKKIVYRISAYNDAYISFETPGKCFGIASFDGGLAMSVLIETDFKLPQWQIQFVEFNGHLKKRITHDQETHQPLFINPRFLASNCKEDTLYVSDSGYPAITALSVSGDRLFQYSVGLHNPQGITVDSENNIYVADGNNVVQIEAGGRDSHSFLEDTTRSKKGRIVDVLYSNERKILVVIKNNGIVTKFTFST